MSKNKPEKIIKITVKDGVTDFHTHGFSGIEILGTLRFFEQKMSLQLLKDEIIIKERQNKS